MTDLHDAWVDNALTAKGTPKPGQLLPALVLKQAPDGDKAHFALSLRPAAVAAATAAAGAAGGAGGKGRAGKGAKGGGSAAAAGEAPPESLSASELKPGQLVRRSWAATGSIRGFRYECYC